MLSPLEWTHPVRCHLLREAFWKLSTHTSFSIPDELREVVECSVKIGSSDAGRPRPDPKFLPYVCVALSGALHRLSSAFSINGTPMGWLGPVIGAGHRDPHQARGIQEGHLDPRRRGTLEGFPEEVRLELRCEEGSRRVKRRGRVCQAVGAARSRTGDRQRMWPRLGLSVAQQVW